jgi:putative cell wall binding repeat protein
VSDDTLERLNPKGSDLAKDADIIRIGETPPRPSGFRTALIKGDDAYELAAAIDRFASSAKGEPSADVIVASGEQAEYAMPAAAWAAFSGDSVLFTKRDSVPGATREALREHEKPRIYLLGPESVIAKGVERDLAKLGKVRRIEGPNPVENAIAFTRYQRGDFGWAITTAGHSFTLANTDRPLDAAAAAVLTARGVPSPLLLTDRADELPTQLEDYFLNVQPGFYDDPREVAYSRAWILGDEDSVSVEAQVDLEQLVDLIPIQENAP